MNSSDSGWRVVSILECFNREEGELSAYQVSHKTGISLPTTYRIVATLAKSRFLERDNGSGKYRIGPSLYALGSLYLSSTDMFKAAEPVTMLLNDLTKETINIVIRDKGNVIAIMKLESKHAFRYAAHIGTVLPAYASGCGKTLLSDLTNDEIDDLYPSETLPALTKKTISTKSQLKKELEMVKKSNVAYDMEGSFDGVAAVASGIRNAKGQIVAGMSIAVPSYTMNEETLNDFSTLIRLGARLVSYRLGFRDQENPVCHLDEIKSWWEQKKNTKAE